MESKISQKLFQSNWCNLKGHKADFRADTLSLKHHILTEKLKKAAAGVVIQTPANDFKGRN